MNYVASCGDGNAIYQTGIYYEHGIGTPPDLKKAVEFYKKGDITYIDVLLDSNNIIEFVSNYFSKGIYSNAYSQKVLEKAKIGAYSADNLKDLPPIWRSKYFKMQPDGSYQISEAMRNEVIFKVFNLIL